MTVLWERGLANFDEMMAVSMASDVRFVSECKAVKMSLVMATLRRWRDSRVLGSVRMAIKSRDALVSKGNDFE